MKRKLSLILIMLLLVAMAFTLFACSGNTGDLDDDGNDPGNPTRERITVPQAMQSTYDGLIAGKAALDSASYYAVESVYTIRTEKDLNYTVTYKANYSQNPQDSEIYLSFLDNDNNANRLSVYYDRKNLYAVYYKENENSLKGDKYEIEKKYIENFSMTAMFDAFFDLVRYADLSEQVFSESGAYIFDKDNSRLNLGLVLDAGSVDRIKVTETRDSTTYSDIKLDIISDSVNTYMDNYLEQIGDKFDVITKKFLGFRLSRVIENRFSYIHVGLINVQRENGVADFAQVSMDGSFRDSSKYQIDGEIGYKVASRIDITEKSNFSPASFEHVNMGENKYVGSINIPSLSKEDFDITISTDLDTKENTNNKLAIDITDAKNSQLMSAYYRDQVFFFDMSGLNSQYIRNAIDIDVFNLPKVYFQGINLTNLINAIYNSGVKMISIILDRSISIGDPENENLYSIIMDNFTTVGNTIYYTIDEQLIQLIRDDDTRTAEIIADLLNIDVEKLDSIIGEDFFNLSSIRLSYNLDNGQIGMTYYYGDTVIFSMRADREDFFPIIFPEDTTLQHNAYNRLVLPDDIKTEIEVEFEVTNAKEASDASKILGAFLGDASGKNTPYNITRNQTLVLRAQASESFVALGTDRLVSEYIMRFDLCLRDRDGEKPLMSVYTNPKNANEFLIKYLMPFGKGPYPNINGIKYRIQRSAVAAALNIILGENNSFEDTSLFGLISEILKSKSSRAQVTNSDGYFNFVLEVETNPETGEQNDPVKKLIGVSDLRARIKARFLFEKVVLNDITPEEYFTPAVNGGSFESAVGIDSLYSPNSKWKDTIEVTFADVGTIEMIPNYLPDSVKIDGDRKTYNPVCSLFGLTADYIVTIYKEIGTYTVRRLVTDTLIIDPAFTNKLPRQVEVEFTNGTTGFLECSIEGLTDEVVTYDGLNRNVFANDKKATYTLRIGGNSIMEISFPVYIAIHNRTVIPLTESGEDMNDHENNPVIGTITIDPYEYAMKKLADASFDPIRAGIAAQNMRLNFYNVYGYTEAGEPLTYNVEGYNFFFLDNLNLDWEFDQTRIKYNGGELFAYAYYGQGPSAIKIAIKVYVTAKVVDYVRINDEELNRYTIDSLVESTYAIPTQTGVGTSVTVHFKDGTSRIVRMVRPDGISDEDYYAQYLPIELRWYIPNPDYMRNVTLEYGATELFGPSMRNQTYAEISIGSLGTDTVRLTVEVPERREDIADLKSANAVKKINVNPDGTFTLDKLTSVQISPLRFGESGNIYNYFSINPYDEEGKLPNEIYMLVKERSGANSMKVLKKYTVRWLTTAGVGGEETNILYIDDNGYARLEHPTTDENDFYIYGVVGTGRFTVTVKAIVKNLASELRSIQYEDMPVDAAEITIDPYKTYRLPAMFTAVLESGERVYRSNIAWMVRKEGDTEWVPIDKPTGGNYDPALYGPDGKYLFGYEGGTYLIRYILEATGSVLRQELFIYVTVEPRTIVSDTINIYETGALVAGYHDINYYKPESKILSDRVAALMNDTAKALRVGVGFEEARTDLVLDRYDLYVDWLRAVPSDPNYRNSLDYLAYILKNPISEEVMQLRGTIFTGTVNEQSLSVTFSLAGLVISNITLFNAEYSENVNAVSLPQKANDGRIAMSTITADGELIIYIPKLFALTVPVNNLERYATPYQYINHVFSRIMMVYYNGMTDSDIIPQLNFGDYNEQTFNRKVLGITDGLYRPTDETTTFIYIRKLSAGSAEENIKVRIVAKVDTRESQGRNITAELYNEFGESCTAEGYILPTYIDVPYINSGVVRYYLDESGWYTSDHSGLGRATSIPLTSINVLSRNALSFSYYYVLPLQGLKDGVQDEGYYYLNVNIPRKNLNDVNYYASAEDSLYNITDGYIKITNAYLFYNNTATYTSGSTTYNTGYDFTKLPDVIYARIVPDWFDATGVNFFTVSWVPVMNAITETDIVNGISREDRRAIATATILSYYNGQGEHVTQTVTVYIEMDAMVFEGIAYSENGVSLDIREDANRVRNTIVIDPYDDKVGYNGIFRLPTVGLVLSFENRETYTVTPAPGEPAGSRITDDIRRFELLDNDMRFIRSLTEIPYGYSGYNLPDANLPINGLLYVKMVMFTGQEIILTINILSRVIDEANIPNTVVKEGEYEEIELPRLYYVDPYNSITHRLPVNANIFFLNSDNYTVLPITRWEILSGGVYKDVNTSSYFYSQASSQNSNIRYAYFNSSSDGYRGGVFTLRAYISMGISASGVSIGEQGFDIIVVILNRSLKVPYSTSYEYDDPIAGLLEDIGGELNEDMFVDYDKYYAEAFFTKGISPEYYYSAISDGPVLPGIDWSRYVDDSFISYEGFRDKSVDGYLFAQNTNINYLYLKFKEEVEATYAELSKSMTWDSFFTVENGKLVPLAYYSTTTINNLKQLLEEIEVEVKNQTFDMLLTRFNAAENTASLAKRMENVLLRSVMSNNPQLQNEKEGIAFLYDMLRTQYNGGDIKTEDRTIYLNWVDMYNNFKGNYPGYVENIDAENLTPYQKLKRDIYNKAYENLYFYGDEYNYNDALYAAAQKKLANYINNAIWLKIFDMATRDERARMNAILGQDSNVNSRANALKVLMISDLKTVGSYGEYASAKISAPKVSFDKFKDNRDTFYFNIYTNLSLDEEVTALFEYNKEAIFEELIQTSLRDVIDAYRKGIISAALQEYFNALKASIVNTMVPVDDNGQRISFYYDLAYHVYDYAVDKNVVWPAEKKALAINAYREYVRTKAIEHILPYSNESTAQNAWNSLYGAALLKQDTATIAVMNRILNENAGSYLNALNAFKLYLQDEASAVYDVAIDYADKYVNGVVVESLLANPDVVGNNDIQTYQVFTEIYGSVIGRYNGPNDIYTLVRDSLNSAQRAEFEGRMGTFGSDGYIRTIYHYLYYPEGSAEVRKAVQDFFYVKISEYAGKDFFDLLYQKTTSGYTETQESLTTYLDNAVLGYTNGQYDLRLRKARVFRNLQNYYANLAGDAATYKALIQDIYDSVLIDIRDAAFYALYNDLFSAYSAGREDFKSTKGNVRAIAFDYLVKAFETDADAVIAVYNNKISDYAAENLYKQAVSLYEEMMISNGFVYITSATDPTPKNYLELTVSEERAVERKAVDYYYYNLATEEEQLYIQSSSGIFGNYLEGGKFRAPEGVYGYLVHRYDLGQAFVDNLTAIRYYCLLDYAYENIVNTVRSVYQSPTGAEYNNYVNTYHTKLNEMGGTGGYSEAAVNAFAKEAYITYQIEQVILRAYLSRKASITSGTLASQGREQIYYQIYLNSLGNILDGQGVTLYGADTLYYRLYNLIPAGLDVEHEDIINDLLLAGDKSRYYEIFAQSSAVLDTIEALSYQNAITKNRYYQTYNAIKDRLFEKMRAEIVAAVEEVEIREGFVKVFDNVIAPYYGAEARTLPVYTEANLINARDINLVDNNLVTAYDEFMIEADDMEKAFLEALYRQEILSKGSAANVDYLKTVAIMAYYVIINEVKNTIVFNIDFDLVAISDIQSGLRTVFNDDAKKETIELLCAYLTSKSFRIAAAYLEKAVALNRYHTDFVAEDNPEGLSPEERAIYNAALAEYVAYTTKIYNKLLFTSMGRMASQYQTFIQTGKFFTILDSALTTRLNDYLAKYVEGVSDYTDATYMAVLESMLNTITVEYKFYSRDHIAEADVKKDARNKHLLYFDVQLLQDEGNSSTQDINKIYLTNLRKKNNPLTLISEDGYRFVYPQIEIAYVDYYGTTTVDDAQDKFDGNETSTNKFLNKITIDPLNPDLPAKVHAYGIYRKTGGAYGILDVGMINVTYDEIFLSLENEFQGNAPEGDATSSYKITAINNKGEQFLIGLTVFYLDRTVQSYYVSSAGYTSSSNMISGGEYARYYNLFDANAGINRIIIDPTTEETVDKENISYRMPATLVANYTNYDSDTYRSGSPRTMVYTNVVWDMAGISYSLKGLGEKSMRILSYNTSMGDGTYNRVSFDYSSNSMTISKYSEVDNTRISTSTFVGVPAYAVWNVTLTVNTKTVDKVYLKNEDGPNTLLASFVSDDISGIGNDERWLVAESGFTVNPYYVEFYQGLVLEFSDGDSFDAGEAIDWLYHPTNGVDKLREIVNKSIQEPNNRYIVAGFEYICETIWIKLMVDDIEIVRPQIPDGGGTTQGYINGGTLYLLAKTPTYTIEKEAQLASFYPYLYYNFSNNRYVTDWRRVPLSFSANAIRNIVLNEGNVYTGILATLGNNNSGANISFTVRVISPKLFAQLNGDTNQHVVYDSVSMPIDGNSRVISSSSDMPQIFGNYFVQLNNGNNPTMFNIIGTTYDVVNEKVTYECRYYISGADEKIAGGPDGLMTLSFKTVLPLTTYNYSGINDIRFVTDAGENFRWKSVNTFEEAGELYWTLGRSMSPSLLPKAYDAATGERIELMWDLDNVNVNLATGPDWYYAVRAYYYSSAAQWLYKEVNIYILREDITSVMVPTTTLSKVYDGNRYVYNLDYSRLTMLRSDGTLAEIDPLNVTIEYRISTATDFNYSTAYRPLNAGTYYIRITVDDYNFYGMVVITLTIEPYRIKGAIPGGLGGQTGLVTDIVFAGADANNYIYYVYNGQARGVVVSSGLPLVRVENWPGTRDQKDRLYQSKLGPNPTAAEVTIAKSAAFNELYSIVTPATQTFLTRFKAQVRAEYNITSENELNAKVFDLLDHDLYICEVVPTIVYKNMSDVILEREPVDVGTYMFTYTIDGAQNNGNYVLDPRTTQIAGWIVINRPDITYSLVSNNLVYNGANQNPLINNLHQSNGTLPTGVTVTYSYRYIRNLEWITISQIRNVGTYYLTVTINGGNNYPSATLENLTVNIVSRDLLVDFDETKTRSSYLSDIVDYSEHLRFDGLVGADRPDDFYSPVVSGNVKSYYTLGQYPIFINGFKLSPADLQTYTKFDVNTLYEINGRQYYKLELKNASEPGSLYLQVDESGRYVYDSLISKFSNYNVYIAAESVYTIYPDGEAILVSNDEELQDAIAAIPENGRATIYLAEGSYSALYIDINASITLIGCYDEDANIISHLERITIAEGEVTLRIIRMTGQSAQDSVIVGDNAGMISILDCYFDGNGTASSRAIVTSDGYEGLLYINNTTITRYVRAVEILSGRAEITSSVFTANSFGVRSFTNEEVYMRNCQFVNTSNEALVLENDNYILLECRFTGNLVAVMAAEDGRNTVLIQNEFRNNGEDFKSL